MQKMKLKESKCLVLVLLVVFLQIMLVVSPVNAKDGKPKKNVSPESPSEMWEDLDQIKRSGYQDGIIWTTCLCDITHSGIKSADDAMDDALSLDMIGQTESVSCKLQPRHVYVVRLMFVCEADKEDELKPFRLQARFPEIIPAGGTDTITSAIFGYDISSVADFYGVSADEAVRIYYVEDSMSMRTVSSKLKTTPAPNKIAEDLLASATGMDMSGAIQKSIELNDANVTTFDLTYRIAVAPMDERLDVTKVRRTDHWLAQQLMGEKYTPAPARELAYIDHDGYAQDETLYADQEEIEEAESTSDWGQIDIVTLLIGIVAIFLSGMIAGRSVDLWQYSNNLTIMNVAQLSSTVTCLEDQKEISPENGEQSEK